MPPAGGKGTPSGPPLRPFPSLERTQSDDKFINDFMNSSVDATLLGPPDDLFSEMGAFPLLGGEGDRTFTEDLTMRFIEQSDKQGGQSSGGSGRSSQTTKDAKGAGGRTNQMGEGVAPMMPAFPGGSMATPHYGSHHNMYMQVGAGGMNGHPGMMGGHPGMHTGVQYHPHHMMMPQGQPPGYAMNAYLNQSRSMDAQRDYNEKLAKFNARQSSYGGQVPSYSQPPQGDMMEHYRRTASPGGQAPLDPNAMIKQRMGQNVEKKRKAAQMSASAPMASQPMGYSQGMPSLGAPVALQTAANNKPRVTKESMEGMVEALRGSTGDYNKFKFGTPVGNPASQGGEGAPQGNGPTALTTNAVQEGSVAGAQQNNDGDSRGSGDASEARDGMQGPEFKRKQSIGVEVCKALERSKTQHVEVVAMRRAQRQKMRATRVSASATMDGQNHSPFAMSTATSHRALEEVIVRARFLENENKRLRVHIGYLNTIQAAQGAQLEELQMRAAGQQAPAAKTQNTPRQTT